MKVLIVGGNGFIGSQITRDLKSQGHLVHCLSRRVTFDVSDQTQADISNRSSYLELLSSWQPKVVIQAAWITEHTNYRANPLNIDYANSSIIFAEDCFRSGVDHFIGLGSAAEYGKPSSPCIAGVTPIQTLDLYSESKIAARKGVSSLAQNYSKRFTWARIFQPYGPNQDSLRFVPSTISSLIAGNPVILKNPNAVLDWISTRDIASALAFTLKSDLPEEIDVGTGVGTPLYVLVQKIRSLLNILPESILSDEAEAIHPLDSVVVGKKSPLFKHGWTPQDNIESGLKWALTS